MEKETQYYIAFVDVPDNGGYVRYYLEKHTPNGIYATPITAKRYSRKKDAEKAAKWLCENIRPIWSNGLDFTAKGKRCGVIYKKIVEIEEETIL